MDETMKALNKRTWALQHNPNCAMPFLVRLVGKGAGIIDHDIAGKTKDILGFGATFEEAAKMALAQI